MIGLNSSRSSSSIDAILRDRPTGLTTDDWATMKDCLVVKSCTEVA